MLMFKRVIVSTASFVMVGIIPTSAQTGRVEVSGFGGYVFSDGVSGNPVVAGDGNIYDHIDPKDSGTYGFTVGVLATPNAEVGFMYGHQFSTLVIAGTTDRELGDLSVNTYHAYFAYNFFEPDAPVRPFLFGGLGATNYGSVDAIIAGIGRTIPGETQFSTTWGGGVKFFPAPHVGVRAAGRWTPTYIKSDSAGWWCDPFWGCYLVGDPQYANHVEFTGGVTLRF